jgi:hypothetical protein
MEHDHAPPIRLSKWIHVPGKRLVVCDSQPARVIGCVWICIGSSHQEQWECTLLLDRSALSPKAFDWAALLPLPDMTRWGMAEISRFRSVERWRRLMSGCYGIPGPGEPGEFASSIHCYSRPEWAGE